MKRVHLLMVVAVALLTASIATTAAAQRGTSASGRGSAAAAPTPLASVKDLMLAIVIPSSAIVFQVASEPPKDDKGWADARLQALAVAESANLLMLPGRVKPGPEWMQTAVKQRDVAMLAVKAIERKDAAALEQASNDLYEASDSCHNKYMDKK
jgi:hypothetical protein